MQWRLVVITMTQNTIFQNLKRHIFYMHHKASSKSNRVFHKIVMAYKIQLLSSFSHCGLVGVAKFFCLEEFMKSYFMSVRASLPFY